MQRTIAAFLAAASLPFLTLAQDQLDFPATGELTVVFPRNDTYAVEAPFPIIFGFHNAPALLAFSTAVRWTLSCPTLWGTGYLDGDRFAAPETDFYWVNSTDTLARVRDGEEDGPPGSKRGQFQNWGFKERELCTLEWEFFYYSQCERLPDGALRIKGGYFPKQRGNVTFTLEPGATRPRDAIAGYEGCSEAGIAVNVNKNHTGCPEIKDDAFPEPKPCNLDVEAVRSSLAAAVVTPTTSMTAVPTRTTAGGGPSTTGNADPDATGGAPQSGDGGNAGNGGDDSDGSSLRVTAGVIVALGAAAVAGMVPLML